MKIVVTFDSLSEFFDSFRFPGTLPAEPVVKDIEKSKTVTEVLNADIAETIAPFEVKEVKTAPAEPDYELLRLDVRSTLAELNKTHAGKPAQKLIADMGYRGLSDVPGELLQELMDKAKEAMNA